jgi:hypothetical protein
MRCAAIRDARPSGILPPTKMKTGKETVKFWVLYQPLTSIGPALGKEKENQVGREICCPPLSDTYAGLSVSASWRRFERWVSVALRHPAMLLFVIRVNPCPSVVNKLCVFAVKKIRNLNRCHTRRCLG